MRQLDALSGGDKNLGEESETQSWPATQESSSTTNLVEAAV
jgi:hypothetical protein